MASSCLSSGGGRAYLIDLEVMKSPSSTSWISTSSSPSSTVSDSSNCALTRKPRTPRKRPNQTYNEAAAILSTAYPKIFPAGVHVTNSFLFEPSELLMPLQEVHSSGFLLDSRLIFQKPDFPFEIKGVESPADIDSSEFDAESILDEEMGEGIESIMGNLEQEDEQIQAHQPINNSVCYGYPVGMGYGMRREATAMRSADRCDWWRFPTVNVIDVAPKVCGESKKKKKVETEIKNPDAGLLLKLKYDGVLNAWSDKESPFSDDSPAAESAGNDVRN